MRKRETEVVEVHAKTEEVRCDIEGCSTVARPPQSELPDRASEPFEEAHPTLEGWIEVRVRTSPRAASESPQAEERLNGEEPLDEQALNGEAIDGESLNGQTPDEETGSVAHLHVCPKHVEGAIETTDLVQKNLTSVLQGYLARQGLDYTTKEDYATEECN